MFTPPFFLALVLSYPVDAASALPPGPERIAQLIAKLGSSRFKERETATQELDAAGAAALDALRKAVASQDPEVCRRADSLIKQIQQRLETAKLLQPKRLRLSYKDTLLSQAISDIESKSGLKLNLEGLTRGQRITLDTGETTFWEAFDQFCKQAGLVERAPAVSNSQEVRVWNGGGVGRQVVIVDRIAGTAPANSSENRLTLTPGKPSAAPTYYAGALRIRALPAAGKALGQTKDETLALFEIASQPGLAWQQTMEVRIDQAVDEHGQRLYPSPINGTNTPDYIARRMGNGILVVDAETGRVVTNGREYPVRLTKSTKPSRVLKEVKGAVLGQAKTPLQALVTVEDIQHASGKSFRGADGTVVKVTEASRVETDHLHLKLRIEGAADLANLPGARRVFRAGRAVLRSGSGRTDDSKLALLDAEDKQYLVSESESTLEMGTNGLVHVMDIVYYPRPGQGEPVRLVYSNRRTVTVEVPFVLKDIPLP